MLKRYSAAVWICLSVFVGCVTEPVESTPDASVNESAHSIVFTAATLGPKEWAQTFTVTDPTPWYDICADAPASALTLSIDTGGQRWPVAVRTNAQCLSVDDLDFPLPRLLPEHEYVLYSRSDAVAERYTLRFACD